jgi:hypothetical protein
MVTTAPASAARFNRRVAVLDFEMHGDRGSLDLVGRVDRVHHAVPAAVFGKIIHHENPRTVDVDFRMHQAFAVLRQHSHHLRGA